MTKPALPAAPSALPIIPPVYGPTNLPPAEAAQAPVKYYGAVIGLDPAKEQIYRELHAHGWPEVLAALNRANVHHFNIFITEIDGRRYLFSHFEYTGDNPEADFASIASDPVTRDKWWPLTDACQVRLPGTPAGAQWRPMEQIAHLP